MMMMMMDEMDVILLGLVTSNKGDKYGLSFISPPRRLILNKFIIYNRHHIRQRKNLPVAWFGKLIL